MIKKTKGITLLLEPFLLGLSCPVGGEHFYILLSHAKISIRAQSVILVIIAIITLGGSFFTEANEMIFNGIHSYYGFLLIFLLIFTRLKISSLFVITCLTISIGFILTFLIVQSFCYYCTSRKLLLSFIYGLFSSRFLPSFFWYFINKKARYKSKFYFLSTALGSSRLFFCFGSMFIKFYYDRFKFTYNPLNREEINKIIQNVENGFTNLWAHKKFLIGSDYENYETVKKFFRSVAFYFFNSSVSLYLTLPPIFNAAYHYYSQNFVSLMNFIKMIAHLFGTFIGIKYPASVSANSVGFLTIILLFYIIYICASFLLYIGKTLSRYVLYVLVMLSGSILGYLASYCLGVFLNMMTVQTCIYEGSIIDEPGKLSKPCCGTKITDKCYCRYKSIVQLQSKGEETNKEKRFQCSKLHYKNGKEKNCNGDEIHNYEYSKEGKNAILICIGDSTNLGKLCCTNCASSTHCTSSDCKCLRLVGVYKLDVASINTCENCQLTIRLECSSTEYIKNQCGSCGSCPCTCSGAGTTNCCCCCGSGCTDCRCLCLKCCTTCDTSKCCCMRFCCCKICNKESKCTCNNCSPGTRVFICYGSGSNGCCIKEIRPNIGADFDGNVDNINEFDISDMFISDCCHVSLQVDLYCTKRNNFFRMTSINYPKKTNKVTKLDLKCNNLKCCPKTQTKCCCPYRELVIASLTYDGAGNNSPSSTSCSSSGGSNGDCNKVCTLSVNTVGSFIKTVYNIRVQLVVICILLFVLMFGITGSFIMLIQTATPSDVVFNPKIKYKELMKPIKNHTFNSVEQLNNRLSTLLIANNMSNIKAQKKNELDDMMNIFKSSMSTKSFVKLSKYMIDKSDHFLSTTKKQELKKLDIDLVLWAYCVGLIHKYFLSFFFLIQKFFSIWEGLWRAEYSNYLKYISPSMKNFSQDFKSTMSFIGNLTILKEKFDNTGLSRVTSWNNFLDYLKLFSSLNGRESHLFEDPLPETPIFRVEYFVERWTHRMGYINFWIKEKTYTFDWDQFKTQYLRIKEWFVRLSPYLKVIKGEGEIIMKNMNDGTEIFFSPTK